MTAPAVLVLINHPSNRTDYKNEMTAAFRAVFANAENSCSGAIARMIARAFLRLHEREQEYSGELFHASFRATSWFGVLFIKE